MSVQIVGDMMIHLNKLENLDCFHYGKYRIKVKIDKKPNEFAPLSPSFRSYILPYLIPTKPFEDDQKQCKDDSAQID